MNLMNILFVTSDRLAPWNGKNLAEPDHIWADLPQKLGCKLLVCKLSKDSPRIVDYRFGPFEYTTEHILDKSRAILLLTRSLIHSNRSGPAFCLGVTRRQAISRLKRALLRQSWRSKEVCQWHKAVVLLTREFRLIQPDVIIFHKEFGPWGAAVKWASRRAGIPAIAHQHYAVNNDLAGNPYELEPWRGLFPDGLLCVTEDQVSRWRSLPIPVALGGSRRSLWNLGQSKGVDEDRAGSVLFAPALGDASELEDVIGAFQDFTFHLKSHPSSKIQWKMPNVVLHSGDFVSVAEKFDVVVTSSPSPIMALTAMNKPYIHVTSYPRVGTCQCAETFKFHSYRNLMECLAQGSTALEYASKGCRHNLAPTLSRAEYEQSLLQILGEGTRDT